MTSTIKVKSVIKNESILNVDYEISEDLKDYFDLNNKFKADYYENISDVPDSILIIPFIGNVLPIIWLTDGQLIVDELDKNYYDSINNTKEAFNKMYKTDIFKGKILVNRVIDNKAINNDINTSVFCSGGIDSTYSLVNSLKNNERTILITLWGSDVWNNNEEGWESLKEYVLNLGNRLQLENKILKSNFRKFINEKNLTEGLLKNRINDSWWHGIQHGIGLITHVAPLAYLHGIKTHYIPATLNPKNSNMTCASFPSIDESVKFIDTNIIHSGFELTREEKVKGIVNYFKENPVELRVCYMDKGRKLNCCNCEKCFRSIMGIIAIGENPRKWGFDISDEEINNIPKYLKKNGPYLDIVQNQWDEIILEANNNKDIIQNSNYKWILTYKNQRNFLEYMKWRMKK